MLAMALLCVRMFVVYTCFQYTLRRFLVLVVGSYGHDSCDWVISLPSIVIYTLTVLTVIGSAWSFFMLTQVPPLEVLPWYA
eukprot:COSAG02_NODE_32292_length_517_cov_2.116945_1_plen_81_part_00